MTQQEQSNLRYGIAFTETLAIHPQTTITTVMHFGYKDKLKAQKVMDGVMSKIDPVTEALHLFEYPAERENELEIGEWLPDDIQTIPVNVNENWSKAKAQ